MNAKIRERLITVNEVELGDRLREKKVINVNGRPSYELTFIDIDGQPGYIELDLITYERRAFRWDGRLYAFYKQLTELK